MDLNKLTVSDKIIGGTGIVLVITLLALLWHSVDTGFGDFTFTAIEERNAFLGILALLLAIAVTAATLVRALAPDTKLPDLPLTWDKAIFFGTVGVAALVLIKLLAETDFLGFGAWLSVLLAAGMVYGGYLKFQADKGAATTS